jgi:tape measure domain-containing protein
MSRTIDSRVVEMQFDNKQFESNVKTTMSTLDRLKQSLNMTGSYDSMSGLSGAVESVRIKFSALEVMAVTALANITNSAINAGKRIVSALTIDPIKMGFSEYETKINAIQTIMSNTASKGTTMKDVTRVIDELNTYADKTIYNFAEMTRNIGTFTAAGVGLEESAKAIQGIANLAAASGSSSQQASTAMYQLSQALATGTVKLMDWNSVVNAGMGGEKFQEALKQTAREHGIAVDQIIKANGSFRDSLQEGWLSADILNQTLNKFTVDGATKYAKSMMESGKWTQEQADALMTEAQAMEDAATKVKTFTQLWDT